ncbi:hypothetical protein GBA52_015122 [Prunus armeniaca]|nr:hypothetical protein GBA52_015122 [Prunus armeniaca]
MELCIIPYCADVYKSNRVVGVEVADSTMATAGNFLAPSSGKLCLQLWQYLVQSGWVGILYSLQ